jgi:hypothetical protein
MYESFGCIQLIYLPGTCGGQPVGTVRCKTKQATGATEKWQESFSDCGLLKKSTNVKEDRILRGVSTKIFSIVCDLWK